MIDLRSDTVTKPTEAMRKAMAEAEVGDDVYGEDPTINRLEELAADKLGKEAALFVTSGTQGNQIAVLTHTHPGQEVILEAESHIYIYEGGSVAALAGVQPRPVQGIHGSLQVNDVIAAIRDEDIHFPETALICMENTHNRGGGAVIPLHEMKAVYEAATERGLPVHLDGARLFNAAVALNIPVSELAGAATTVQICLSKGLGAPVGSILAGDKAFIKRARKWRKRLGGGLRQAGILAAPGIIALTDMVDRLAEDHARATQLANQLAEMDGLSITNRVQTNMIMVEVSGTKKGAQAFTDALKDQGVLASAFGPTTIRLVTHFGIDDQSIKKAVEAFFAVVRSA